MATERIRALQVLRFAAASMVVVTHAGHLAYGLAPGSPEWTSPYSTVGSAGVDIFFVLSGVIIYRTAFTGAGMTACEFIRRRFLRIAPIYYLTTAIFLALLQLGGIKSSWKSIATSFLFWPAWGNEFALPVIGVGWSLCFEMLFYVSAAAALWWRPALGAVIAIFALSWLGRVETGWPVFQFLGNPEILEFGFGVAIAVTWPIGLRAPLWIAAALIALGVGLLLAFPLPIGWDGLRLTVSGLVASYRVVVYGLPAALIVLGALAVEPHLRGAWLRAPVFLGDASYAIYLVHLPTLAIVSLLMRVTLAPLPVGVTMPLFVAIAVAAGAAVHQFVEKPMARALKRRYGGYEWSHVPGLPEAVTGGRSVRRSAAQMARTEQPPSSC